MIIENYSFPLVDLNPIKLSYLSKAEPPPTINQHFVRFFHNERVNYTCGWPDSNIPPFEPYTIEEYQMLVESNSEFTS